MLLDNEIDRDFQMMLLPLNILEYLYCQPKFRITQTHIAPNGILENLLCTLGVFIMILANVSYVSINSYIPGNDEVTNVVNFVFCTDAAFYIVYSLLLYAMNIIQTEKYVQLIIKMQNAYRILHTKNGLKRFQKSNWIFVVGVFLFYFSYNLSYTVFNIYRVEHLFYDLVLFYFDVNVIVTIRIVMFLEYELILWKNELNEFLKTCSTTNHKQLVKYLADVSYKERGLLSAYSDIIGAFKLCPSVFGMSILLLLVEGFGHPLLYIQLFIDIGETHAENAQFQTVSFISLLVTFIWTLKTVSLFCCLSVVCQRFYLAVVDVETTCAVVRCDEGCLGKSDSTEEP
ncbi:uncharacterized protein LOC134674136 [Cydia fagiglandana]|uniref:uncharacterized protein LOC134674136 n=1 Tax=Cydia fagiglandana TaxID=1458189 RepID=UPI002FEE0074